MPIENTLTRVLAIRYVDARALVRQATHTLGPGASRADILNQAMRLFVEQPLQKQDSMMAKVIMTRQEDEKAVDDDYDEDNKRTVSCCPSRMVDDCYRASASSEVATLLFHTYRQPSLKASRVSSHHVSTSSPRRRPICCGGCCD